MPDWVGEGPVGDGDVVVGMVARVVEGRDVEVPGTPTQT